MACKGFFSSIIHCFLDSSHFSVYPVKWMGFSLTCSLWSRQSERKLQSVGLVWVDDYRTNSFGWRETGEKTNRKKPDTRDSFPSPSALKPVPDPSPGLEWAVAMGTLSRINIARDYAAALLSQLLLFRETDRHLARGYCSLRRFSSRIYSPADWLEFRIPPDSALSVCFINCSMTL